MRMKDVSKRDELGRIEITGPPGAMQKVKDKVEIPEAE
jgi:hypothetical protein